MRTWMRAARRTWPCLALLAWAGLATGAELSVRLDAHDAARRKVHSEISIAAVPGPLTLVFARWMPGEHGPTGPLDAVIGLEFRANGQRLAWTRDPYDMYALRIDVPAGADRVEVAMDTALPTEDGTFSEGSSSTEQLAVLSWNESLLFPKGIDAERVRITASLLPPPGWKIATSLESRPAADGWVQFEEITLARLIDSPVQMGRHARVVAVAGSAPRPDLRHEIAFASDSEAALVNADAFATGTARMVAEAGALFGSRPYRHYTWLLTLSDHVAHFGLEHHESSDDRSDEAGLSEADRRMAVAGLLGHEFVHSWNGKYRRPAGLLSPDYQQPLDGSLLWVYEGLTEYWGDVVTTRAGMMTLDDYRETVATYAATFDVQPGARWRPLADTAVAAQHLYDAPGHWEASRRGTDFYDASVFLWLDVDAKLRADSRGRRSLDDFAQRFYAGPDGTPQLKPYVEQDVYDALSQVAPGDWRGLVHRHLDRTDTTALLGALEHSGWKLVYTAQHNTWVDNVQKRRKVVDRRWSLGLVLDGDGGVVDVIEGAPAPGAGIGPGMKLVAVNGRRYSVETLDTAIVEAQQSRQPIELLVENADYFRTVRVACFDGPRFPHLVRIEGQPDLLTPIVTPRVKAAGRQAPVVQAR